MTKLPEVPEQKIEDVGKTFERYRSQIGWLLRWRLKFLKPIGLENDGNANLVLAFVINSIYLEHKFVWQSLLKGIESHADKFTNVANWPQKTPKYVAYFGLLAVNHYSRKLQRELERIESGKKAQFSKDVLESNLRKQRGIDSSSTLSQLMEMYKGNRNPMFFGVALDYRPVWYDIAIPKSRIFTNEYVGKEIHELEYLMKQADIRLVTLLAEFVKLIPDRAYFMDEGERKILLVDKKRYQFVNLYLGGVLEKSLYLSNLKQFEKQMIGDGVSKITLKALRELPEINKLIAKLAKVVENMKLQLKKEMKFRSMIINSTNFNDVIKYNDSVKDAVRMQNATWLAFKDDFKELLMFLSVDRRVIPMHYYREILRQIHVHLGYIDE
jgi:hypothetical protein